MPSDVDKHLTYTAQQRLDGYAEAIHHTIRRKATFDKKVLKSRAGIAMFKKGQLVQAHSSDLMNTLSTDRKLQPTWSGPYCIREQILNLYKLEDLDGTPRAGEYSARWLRAFIPRERTELAKVQKKLEVRIEEEEREEEEGNRAAGEEMEAANPQPKETNTLGMEDHDEDSDETDDEEELGWGYTEESAAKNSTDEEAEEHPEDDDSNIGGRVAARQRGRRQKDGGRWNR